MEVRASYHQERLWFIDKFEAGNLYRASPIYHNIPLIFQIRGVLDRELLKKSIAAVITRHEVLRTRVVTRQDKPVQVIAPAGGVKFRLEFLDSCGYSAEDQDNHALTLALDFARQALQLEGEFLIRAKLIQVAENRSILVIGLHHMIIDRYSLKIISREIFLYYQSFLKGEEPGLPELSAHYADFSQWQQSFTGDDEVMEPLLFYWRRKLKGKPKPLELPTDRPRMPIHIFHDGSQNFQVDGELVDKVEIFCQQNKTDKGLVLLAAFKVLLFKYSHQGEILVGMSEENRNQPGLEHIVGPIANLLVLRSFLDGKSSFMKVLQDLEKTVAEAKKYKDIPFEKLDQELKPAKDMSRTVFFDVLFQFDDKPIQVDQSNNLEIEILETNLGWGKYDLNLLIQENAGTFLGFLVYNRDYYHDSHMASLTVHYIRLLEKSLENPHQAIADVFFLSEEECNRLLAAFKETDAGYPRDKTIHRLFVDQAARTPHYIAVTGMGDGPWGMEQFAGGQQELPESGAGTGFKPMPAQNLQLDYKELDEKSNQWAQALMTKGVRPETIVSIMLERSMAMIIGILGILKAGGAYLPIDPHYPQERIEYMLDDSGADILLTSRDLCNKIEGRDRFKTCPYIESIDDCMGEGPWPEIDGGHLPPASATNMAYIIYTSGTTGRPKGVAVEHCSLVGLLYNDRFQFDFDSTDVWTMFHSFCFDFSVWEIHGALLYGGKVVIIPEMIARDPEAFAGLLEKERVTVLNQTPSAFFHLVNEDLKNRKRKLRLRYIIFGGEALYPGKLAEWNNCCPTICHQPPRLINMFGITEITVHATYKEIGQEDIALNRSNIGKPLPNLTTYVLDENRRLSPQGVIGELYIGGLGLARGYLNKPRLTAERFIENPFHKGERLYHSGDLVRCLENGDMVYFGRSDHQVQVRGFRIEPGEIENQVLTCAGVKEAVVIAREDGYSDKYLCAYIVAENSLDPAEVRRHLQRVLPDYMIPTYFVPMDKIPLTPNGKVDRQGLPAPEIKPGKDYTPPRNEIERRLVEIWSEVLGQEARSAAQPLSIGIDDNFFELGGHSLRAAILIGEIHRVLEVKIPLEEIFKSPRIRELAAYIERANQETFVSIAPAEKKEYYPLSSAQKRFYILQHMEQESTAYNLQTVSLVEGKLDLQKLENAFRGLIKRHEVLRTSFQLIEGEGIAVQVVEKEARFAVEYFGEQPVVQRIIRGFIQPFDLSRPPLFRVGLIKTSEHQHILIIDMHHLITDGTSMELLVWEFLHLYSSGVEGELPPLRLHYKDAAVWQNGESQRRLLRQQEEWWLKEFPPSQEVPILNLPLDHERGQTLSSAGSRIGFFVAEADTAALKALARMEEASLFMVLLALFNVLLSKISGQEDIVIGSPAVTRRHADMEPIIGLFLNTLALRNYPTDDKTFRGFLRELRQRTIKAYENQDYPYEELLEKRLQRGHPGRNSLFDVLFAFQNNPVMPGFAPVGKQPGLSLKPYPTGEYRSPFDLIILASLLQGRIDCFVYYRTSLFEKETILGIIENFKQVLGAVVQDADVPLQAVTLSNRLLTASPGSLLEDEGDFGF